MRHVAIALLMSLGAAGPVVAQGSKIWENYDFVPGSKVLFYTDFSEDRVGNFARALKYVQGRSRRTSGSGGRSAVGAAVNHPGARAQDLRTSTASAC